MVVPSAQRLSLPPRSFFLEGVNAALIRNRREGEGASADLSSAAAAAANGLAGTVGCRCGPALPSPAVSGAARAEMLVAAGEGFSSASAGCCSATKRGENCPDCLEPSAGIRRREQPVGPQRSHAQGR